MATRIGHLAVRKARLLRVSQDSPGPLDHSHLQSILTLTLGTVRVNRRTGQTHVEQVVVQEIGLGLCVDEDESTRRRHGEKKIVQALLLQSVLGIDDLFMLLAPW